MSRRKIGLIDVDNWKHLEKCFPNLPLMKISSYCKGKGYSVEWYNEQCRYDVVFLSKVFSFTKDYDKKINSKKIIRGGTGYAIFVKDGKEWLDNDKNNNLTDKIEHVYPDYDLYGIKDVAYGFMSRGCPRGCSFCHVGEKEGKKSYKVADLSEFWKGQKNIKILDPNILACPDWKELLQQLIDSNSWVDFTQGIDIRLMNAEKYEMMTKMKIKHIHFAWDRYEDGEIIKHKMKMFKKYTNWARNKITVYILVNYDTTIEQDIERVNFCRKIGFNPYVMRYNKESIPRGHVINSLARYANNKRIFWLCPSFEQYMEDIKVGLWV